MTDSMLTPAQKAQAINFDRGQYGTFAEIGAAAQLLESGESLSAVARQLNISRPSLRNWRSRNPKLNAAFATFEANKLKQEAERARVRHFKKVASGMVEAAREGASDPIQMAIKADQKASEPEQESKPISSEEAWRRIQLYVTGELSVGLGLD